VTISAEVRKALDIGAGDDVLFEVVEVGEARIRVLKRGRLSDLY
jgi:bifunctional DNA-binding transcriptional regulator/antitoxin component of YhaV-PrlF toxin-antitoxin module